MIKTPDMMYGALKANVDTSGLTLSKALNDFNQLLTDNKWKEVGEGFDDINAFLKTIDLSDFKFSIEQRKEVSKKLADIQASQRATAKALGVGQATISSDLNESDRNRSPKPKTPIVNQDVTEDDDQNRSPEPTEDVETFKIPSSKEIFESNLKKKEKQQQRKEVIEKQKEEIKESSLVITGKYDVIVLDPPWNYGREYDPESSRVANPYPEMTQDEIKMIDIPANDNAIMWLWTTHAFMQDAFELLEHWDFDFKAILTWDKENIGMGHWLRMQTEFCLLAIKGKPIWDNTKHRDIIREKRREHSRKPDGFYLMVDDICYGSKLEFFSRSQREGWESLGNDINKF